MEVDFFCQNWTWRDVNLEVDQNFCIQRWRFTDSHLITSPGESGFIVKKAETATCKTSAQCQWIEHIGYLTLTFWSTTWLHWMFLCSCCPGNRKMIITVLGDNSRKCTLVRRDDNLLIKAIALLPLASRVLYNERVSISNDCIKC